MQRRRQVFHVCTLALLILDSSVNYIFLDLGMKHLKFYLILISLTNLCSVPLSAMQSFFNGKVIFSVCISVTTAILATISSPTALVFASPALNPSPACQHFRLDQNVATEVKVKLLDGLHRSPGRGTRLVSSEHQQSRYPQWLHGDECNTWNEAVLNAAGLEQEKSMEQRTG